MWPVALLALSSATALAALRLLAQLLRTAISAGTPGPPSSLGTKCRSAPALQRAALLLALAPAVSAVVEAAGRALQASAVGVCSEASFAGRQTLSAGYGHTCAMRAAGGAVGCWGWNAYGLASVPAAAAAGGQVAIAAGNAHSCALAAGGAVGCWGSNDYGQATALLCLSAAAACFSDCTTTHSL